MSDLHYDKDRRTILTGPRRVGNQEPIAVMGIHLFRIGEHVVVSAEIDGKWVEVIRERHDGAFSHIVEPSGMRSAAAR